MTLSGQQRGRLHEALLSAFPDRDTLARFADFSLNVSLVAIAGEDDLAATVYELIRWAEAQGRLEDLVTKAQAAVPGNPALRSVAPEILQALARDRPAQPLRVGVPRRRPAIVGRDQLIAEVRAQLVAGGTPALAAITGLPGVGKTALAQALVHDEELLRHITGGVLWADLGPQADVVNALNMWGTGLGLDLSAEDSAAARVRRLNEHLEATLGGRPALVVLDDAWHWEEIAPFHEELTTPGLAVLLTTRHLDLARRFAGPRPFTVPELPEDQAIEVLASAAPEAQEADPAGLRALAQAVGGLPLALLLIGAELAASAGQGRWVRDAIGRLRSAEAQLALRNEQYRRDVAGVPMTLQAVVELSLAALPAEEHRRAFTELGAFAPKPADFAREAALAVWRVGEQVGDERLETLYQRGLLEVAGEDRFALHQLLAAVAAARLGGDTGARERHFDHFLGLLARDPEDWQAIEREWPQVRQAWAWAGGAPGGEGRALALTWSARLFMERRGLGAEQLAWYGRALAAARALGRRGDEAAVLNNIGAVHRERGEPEAALARYREVLAIDRELGDRAGEATTLNNIGEAHRARGERAEALAHYQQALGIARELGDRAGEARVLNNIGLVHRDRGELDQALAHYERALPLRRAAGDRAGEATTLNNIGGVHRARGEPEAALEHFEWALANFQAIGDRWHEAMTLTNIASVLAESGQLAQAVAVFGQAVALKEALGHPTLARDRALLADLRARLDATRI